MPLVLLITAAVGAAGFAPHPEPHFDPHPDCCAGTSHSVLIDHPVTAEAVRSREIDELRHQIRNASLSINAGDLVTEPVYANEPYFVFKVPREPRYEKTLREELHKRRDELGTAFNIANVTVLTADLSTDVADRKNYDVLIRRQIPAPHRALASGMKALAQVDGRPSVASIAAALKAYRDKTLIVIGHTTSKSGEFLWTNGTRSTTIDLALWNELARDNGVNLITIGCKSAEFSNIGSPYLVNSATLLDRLGSVLRSTPSTFGEFYTRLAGEGLILAVNPLVDNLSYVTISVEDKSGGVIATIKWPSAPPPPVLPGLSPFPVPQGSPFPSTATVAQCAASSTSEDEYDVCVNAVAERIAAQDRLRAAARIQASIPSLRRAMLDAQSRYWRTVFYAIITAVIVAFLLAEVRNWPFSEGPRSTASAPGLFRRGMKDFARNLAMSGIGMLALVPATATKSTLLLLLTLITSLGAAGVVLFCMLRAIRRRQWKSLAELFLFGVAVATMFIVLEAGLAMADATDVVNAAVDQVSSLTHPT